MSKPPLMKLKTVLGDALKFRSLSATEELGRLFDFSVLALSDAEVEAIVARAVADSGAPAPADMGKVMALVKPQIAGRADMAEVSKRVKAKLSGA